MTLSISLYSPHIRTYGHKVRDSEILYLGQWLFDNFYTVQILDYYSYSPEDVPSNLTKFKPQILILHLGRTELLIERRLDRILDEVHEAKQALGFRVIAIGSVAASLGQELIGYKGIIDAVVSQADITYGGCDHLSEICTLIQKYFFGFTSLTEKFIRSAIDYSYNDVAGISASRGCVRKCSFCSYNNGLSLGWQARDIDAMISDITLLHKNFNISQFSVSDSNFSSTISLSKIRSSELANLVSGLPFRIRLSLNLNLEGIDEEVLENLRNASVRTFLTGLESLSEKSLAIYNKRQSISRARQLVVHAETLGLVPIVSYILFHAWLTMDDLRLELEGIDSFGRHRIPQFLANSRVIVMPKTAMEEMLRRDNLLVKDMFYRSFLFTDPVVANLFERLRLFFLDNSRGHLSDSMSIADLKLSEWRLIKQLVSTRHGE